MGADTKIEWCDFTFNSWLGCSKVSPGCDHCYAERFGKRFGIAWGPGQPRKRTSDANWREPLRWNAQPHTACIGCGWRGPQSKTGLIACPPGFDRNPGLVRVCPSCSEPLIKESRARVFCASLADVFDNEVPDQWRDELFGLIAATPNLCWLVLTKRIGNAKAYITDPATPLRVDTMKHVVMAGRLEELHAPERIAAIPGWTGYFITSKGRVLSDRTNAGARGADRHEIKPQPGEAGHERVMLRVNGESTRQLVHRLVLTAFDRPPRGDEQGCHIDGDPQNNALWNLRWGDQSSNWQDSKRHGTRRRYSKLSEHDVETIRSRQAAGETAASLGLAFGVSDTQIRNIVRGAQWQPERRLEWPLQTVWLGATVCNQEEAARDIPKLLATPAAVRFLSIEPILGEINIRPYLRNESWRSDGSVTTRGILGGWRVDWVIVGGESGPHARPTNIEWIRSIVQQCQAAQVPVFVKQGGSSNACVHDRKGGHFECFPLDLQVREFPNAA